MQQTLAALKSGQLKGIKRLKIAEGLTSFPEEIFDLADTLEILDLSGNKLSELPKNFGLLKHLKIVFFSDNLFTVLPEVLSDCLMLEMIGFKANQLKIVAEKSIPPTTKWLILTNNQIQLLPDSIGDCKRLQKCMLAGNQLKSLPASMANCHHLELLRLSANQFEQFPDWLFELPRLSWLALAGNPVTQMQDISTNLTALEWHQLEIKQLLGEGASGLIYKANIKSTAEEVAVKVFKGEVTSDGLPEDEMKATIAVGKHIHIVGVKGRVVHHPQDKQGLVFELIPQSFKNLAGPPSFESCTRDIFKEGTQFTIHEVLRIIKGISSAALHLHQKGIMHGDLYAHNILIDPNAFPLFGDFGGAMLYHKSQSWASYLERIEVRAFGVLLDDLLQHVILDKAQEVMIRKLQQLKNDCWKTNVLERPNFEEIVSFLQ